MATTTVTPNQDAVVSEIEVAAPPERVFQALIDPQQVMQWWTNDQCRIKSFSFEPRPGGRWTYDTVNSKLDINGVHKFHCEGEVLEFDPPRLLAYTWVANWHEDKSRRTLVRWELTPQGKGTRVKVTHSGLAQEAAARKDYTGGWPGVIGLLKKFIESESF